jgi:hypothetical protein
MIMSGFSFRSAAFLGAIGAIAPCLLGAPSLHAQVPAVELEGYFAAAAIRPANLASASDHVARGAVAPLVLTNSLDERNARLVPVDAHRLRAALRSDAPALIASRSAGR